MAIPKKAQVKKATTKKATTKKTTAKKTAAKKVPAKKAPIKRVTLAKVPAKKSTKVSSSVNPTVKQKKSESEILAEFAIYGIKEKKGSEIVSIDLRKVAHTIVDFFIVCHAESTTQVDAIARSVEETILEKTGEKVWHSEGQTNAEWILLDYVSTVVHIFREDRRRFYNLERLWADAEVKNVL